MFYRMFKYVTFVILLSWGMSSSFAQQTLLNENGDLETGDTTGWETGGVIAEVISSNDVLHGNYSLHVYDLSTVNAWASQARALAGYTFEQGKVYTFSCFIKTEPGVTRNMSMRFQEHGTWTVFPAKTITINDEWTEYYITTDVLTTTYTPARAGWEFGTSAEEIWFDEAKVYEGEYVPTVLIDPPNAKKPNPAAGATDVHRDVILNWMPAEIAVAHDVYFGEIFENVNDADKGNPLSVLVSQNQIPNTYDHPVLLEFGQTYYWRIDEIDADGMVHKGNIWSFTVEQFAPQITDITATASSFALDQGPEKTVDGSGLDEFDQHSIIGTDMWLSAFGGAQPTWIQYEFDKAYALYELWIWNSNQQIEPQLGVGIMDVTIEYSLNGEVWTKLDDFVLNAATGTPDYSTNTIINMKRVVAQFVRLTPTSNFKNILEDQYGLSEVRFFFVPVTASDPAPAVGESDVPLDVILDWRAGREAFKHEVYLSKDKTEVTDGAETALIDTVDVTYFQPVTLEYGQIYYWKINEVNDAAAVPVREGEVWEFSTIENFVVDDFESYSAENPIWETWLDGLGFGSPNTAEYNPGNGTGSAVGDDTQPSSTEETIVNSGRQSMSLFYNNNKAGYANYSETQRIFEQARDWTTEGVSQLSLWFRGHAASVGSFVESPVGTFMMTGSGKDIWDEADEFHFAYKMLTGPGTIVAKVESLQNTNVWAKAGVMIRETLDADSIHAFACITPDNGVAFQGRQFTATDSFNTNTGKFTAPYWIKLERDISGEFAGYHSANGSDWELIQQSPVSKIPMNSNVYVGLALTSHDTALTCEAVFSNVTITGNVSGQWTNQDIGIESNDPEPLYIGLADSAGNRATIEHEDPAAALMDTFTLWSINLADFADQGVNIADIKEIFLGLGNPTAPVAGGSGAMYIDDIAIGNPVVSPVPENLIPNGGFEDGATTPLNTWEPLAWSLYGDASMQVVSEDPIEGDYCLEVIVPAATENVWNIGIKQPGHILEEGKKYTLSVWFRSKSGPLDIRMVMERDGDPYDGYSQTFTITDEWAEYHVTSDVVPGTISPAAVIFQIGYAAGEFLIDNIRLYEGDYVPTDGSPPAEAENLLGHGSFESGEATPLSTWESLTWSLYGDASMQVVSEDPIEGDYCLEVIVPAATANIWNIGIKQPGHALEEGKTYTLSVWFKSKSGPLEIRGVMERDGDPYDGYSQTFTITDEWAQYSVISDVVPATISPAAVIFQIGYAAGEFLIDNVELYSN